VSVLAGPFAIAAVLLAVGGAAKAVRPRDTAQALTAVGIHFPRVLPARAVVRLRCTGRGCPFRSRTLERPGEPLTVPGLRAGQTIQVLITAPAHDGKLVRWRLRSSRTPVAGTRCVPLGNSRPRPRC